MDSKQPAAHIEVIDLTHYWYLLRQYAFRLFVLALVISVIAVLIAFTLQPVYKATTSILIESKEAKVVAIEDVYGLANDSKEYLLTQYKLLESRELAERVVRKLDLVNTQEFNPYFKHTGETSFFTDMLSFVRGQSAADDILTQADIFAATVKELHRSISVSPVRKTQLVNVSVESSNAQLAARCANTLAQSYIELQLDAKAGVNKQASTWLSKRLTELKSKLKQSQERLQAYQKEHNLIDVKGSGTLVTKELETITAGLVSARTKRLELQSTYEKLKRTDSQTAQKLSTLPAVLRHPLVQELRSNEIKGELKISELSKRYGPKHPKMIAAHSELEAAKNATLIQMRRIADGIKNDYLAALDNEKSLEAALEDVKAKIRHINRFESKMNEFVREVDTNKELYKTFYSRVRETNVTDDLQVANARIIDSAIVPKKPVRPNKKLIMALAFVLTFLLGFALVFLYDMLNATIKTPDDVDHKLGVAMLGLVPLISTGDKSEWAFSMADNADKRFCEAIRTVRTSITLATMGEPSQVLMITSSVPEEGKSTTVINLASAYTQMDEKVLLIDADMRRPKIANELRLEKRNIGLSDVINEPQKVADAVQHVARLNLDVMASGSDCSNPLELLSSSNFVELLQQLRQQYDRIFIDTAPLQSVSDALYLNTLVDASIYIVKSDCTQDKYIKNGLTRLQKTEGHLLGVVLNQVDVDKQKKLGATVYSGYYDYHSYGSDS